MAHDSPLLWYYSGLVSQVAAVYVSRNGDWNTNVPGCEFLSDAPFCFEWDSLLDWNDGYWHRIGVSGTISRGVLHERNLVHCWQKSNLKSRNPTKSRNPLWNPGSWLHIKIYGIWKLSEKVSSMIWYWHLLSARQIKMRRCSCWQSLNIHCFRYTRKLFKKLLKFWWNLQWQF